MSPTHQEKRVFSTSGYLALLVAFVALLAFFGLLAVEAATDGAALGMLPALATLALSLLVMLVSAKGLYMLQPNEAAALMLFGAYVGTDRQQGLRWANPFFSARKISLRARTFLTDKIKVNDLRGNPVEIAGAIVWRVEDSAKALFDVEDYEVYIRIQSETALRHLASTYPYDSAETEDASAIRTLRGDADAIAGTLAEELAAKLAGTGIIVTETKLTHLAYAPEIASAMLRRQQAEAVLSARRKIVEGAVGMVEMALEKLDASQIVQLEDERRAAMVSNLLVVLCGEHEVTPVVNSGTLYN